MISVEGDDDIAGGAQETLFVGSTVTSIEFADDNGASRPGDVRSLIGRIVVDHDCLIDERREFVEHQPDAQLLVQAGYDDRNPVVFVQLQFRLLILDSVTLRRIALETFLTLLQFVILRPRFNMGRGFR